MLCCVYENPWKRTQKQRDLWLGSDYVENIKKVKMVVKTEILVSTCLRIFLRYKKFS